MTIITKDNGQRELVFDVERMVDYIERNTEGIEVSGKEEFTEKVLRFISQHDKLPAEEIPQLLIRTALENVDEAQPDWTYVAARVLLSTMYKEAGNNRRSPRNVKYGNFVELIEMLVERNIYRDDILKFYSKEELKEAGEMIVPERDNLFTYPALRTLATRYLAVDGSKRTWELPQERWMIIALTLMSKEDKENRMTFVKEMYDVLSNLYATVATPTLANSGKPHQQLSSCFIDTIDDSLRGIYDSNTDIATLSKNGGGIGVYIGKVRSRGSSIRGHKGVASGTIPWIRQLNNTAVSVDQLGVRQGAVAVYQDAWHKDILAHLDLKLNNGDERLRAHDIFPGITVPDLYMERLEARGDWTLFDPHQVREVTGQSLEDLYDEEKGAGSFREFYEKCEKDPRLDKEVIPAIDIMKRVMRSQLETGTPFMFYRDTVNRMNANKHEGMVYCSNLCTEITQNQTPTTVQKEYMTEDGRIIVEKLPGDFVVCNLSSLNLGRVVDIVDGKIDEEKLGSIIAILIRALDNVIDINEIPVLQAAHTNQRYRAVGLGTFGWHHLLAKEGVQWESEEAVELTDKLYEAIAYHSIKASTELSKEKGSYPLFEGSDWDTGEYFTQRGYFDEGDGKDKWEKLYAKVKEDGMRNGYLMAVAPNASTSIIAGSTASIDPVFKPFYYDEKKDAKYPITAPDLDHNTYDIYRRSAYIVDQRWSVEQNIARQKHVDQAISFNMYVPNTIHVAKLLDLHIQAWKGGMKTTYYVRSTVNDIEECEWCHS